MDRASHLQLAAYTTEPVSFSVTTRSFRDGQCWFREQSVNFRHGVNGLVTKFACSTRFDCIKKVILPGRRSVAGQFEKTFPADAAR